MLLSLVSVYINQSTAKGNHNEHKTCVTKNKVNKFELRWEVVNNLVWFLSKVLLKTSGLLSAAMDGFEDEGVGQRFSQSYQTQTNIKIQQQTRALS